MRADSPALMVADDAPFTKIDWAGLAEDTHLSLLILWIAFLLTPLDPAA
jgi:hypothetical protein